MNSPSTPEVHHHLRSVGMRSRKRMKIELVPDVLAALELLATRDDYREVWSGLRRGKGEARRQRERGSRSEGGRGGGFSRASEAMAGEC